MLAVYAALRQLIAVISLLITIAASAPALARDEGGGGGDVSAVDNPGQAQPAPSDSDPQAEWALKSQRPFNLNFPGGTLNEFIAAIQAASPVPLNVAMAPELGSLKLGPVKFQQASIYTAIQVIPWSLIESENYELQATLINGPDGFPTPTSASFYIRGIRRHPDRDDPAFARARSFAIGELINAPVGHPDAKVLKLDDVLGAIEAAVRLPKFGATPPEMLMHKQTSLLIVQGTPEQMNLAAEIIAQLSEDLNRARREARERSQMDEVTANRQRAIAAQITQAESTMREADDRIEKLRPQVETRLKKSDRGPGEQAELDNMISNLNLAERQRDRAEEQLHSARADQTMLPGAIGAAPGAGGVNNELISSLQAQIDALRRENEELKKHH